MQQKRDAGRDYLIEEFENLEKHGKMIDEIGPYKYADNPKWKDYLVSYKKVHRKSYKN